LCVFRGCLYAGAGNASAGALLYRSKDGEIWEQAITPAFGDPDNEEISIVRVFQNRLHVGLKNSVTGLEIWRTADGELWQQVNEDGFGDSGNTGSNRSNAAEEFQNRIYVGTANAAAGGELWRQLTIYEPLKILEIRGDASRMEVEINTVPDEQYTIEYSDEPRSDPASWRQFANTSNGAGSWLETGPSVSTHTFVDDFTPLTSGAAPTAGLRLYRVRPGSPAP
jgi:hypothetical protein